MLEDGTGRIRAFHDTTVYATLVTLNAKLPYVRVFGVIQAFSNPTNTRSWNRIKVQTVRAVEDVHEIYFHLMEVVLVTRKHEHTPSTSGHENSNERSAGMLETPAPVPVDSLLFGGNHQVLPEVPQAALVDRAASPVSSDGYETASGGIPSPLLEHFNALEIPAAVVPANHNHRRDPLSFLNGVQRDIMLAIYENQDNLREDEDGHVGVFVKDIADRLTHHQLEREQIADLLDRMIDMDVIVAVDEDRLLYQPVDAREDLQYALEEDGHSNHT